MMIPQNSGHSNSSHRQQDDMLRAYNGNKTTINTFSRPDYENLTQ